MKSKKILCATLSIILTLGLAGCGAKTSTENNNTTGGKIEQAEEVVKKDGGTMIFSANTDPTCLNPFFQQNRITFTVNNALFNPLFIVDKDEVRYYLAEKMEASEDKLTYTVKLKDNLKWHDGEKITADDIVFTVKTIQDEKNGIGDRESFVVDGKNIDVIKKDDLTVEFKLPQVFAPFDANLGSLRPIPKHIFEGEKDLAKSEKNNTPVGSGPFKFKEWKKGESLTLERFEDYHGGKPHLESIVYRITPDKNTSKVAFQNGEVNAAYLTEEDYEKFSNDDNFKTASFEEGMLSYMIFNENNENLKKKEVRQAISYAINKDEILKAQFKNLENTTPANSILAPSTKYYTDDVPKYENNIEKAKELMKSAGVENIKLNFQYSYDTDKDTAMIIQQQLKEIGIEVEPVSIDANAFFAKLVGEQERDFDLILNGYVMGVDPNGYASAYTTGSMFNAMNYSNKEMDDLWKEGAREADEGKRKEIYEKIQKDIAEDAVIYPIQYTKSLIAISSNFGGMEEAKTVPIYMFEDLSKLYMIEK
ncbi:MAG: ABC transporter substrate-binding protein [Clostridium argentinense]|uniref:ABC transporter substrate-binding protein n=1 Tax=Clostridium faecium TaxID=2762223 RepID=A0ABR8YRX3_9CLOT|nr:ABC transporter substrate-binding protein [Clostridium faecium]MBD8047011.1 ABC transporter substrate-binding protein [Clostridium faecium]MBS5823271.1 ABC transporter substrate-binding protein [Clostridium argentinense]MDU1349635.1 ABC transporter substrate-binding protein [Clostridium argentinense]